LHFLHPGRGIDIGSFFGPATEVIEGTLEISLVVDEPVFGAVNPPHKRAHARPHLTFVG
jgi:hypothetical protein